MTAPSESPRPKFHDAVHAVLEQAAQPLHVNEVTKRLLASGVWSSGGKTPAATVAAKLYTDIKKKGAQSQFVQAGKATFALNPAVATSAVDESGTAEAETSAGLDADEPQAGDDGAASVAPLPSPAATGVKKRLSFTDATEDVLRRHAGGKPMHYRDITEKVLAEDLVKTSGKTPEATLYAQIIQENARAEKRGKPTRFVRHGKGLVGLSEWLERGVQAEIAKHNAAAEAEMLKQLRELDPTDFEQLIGEFLRALGITDVEVTAYHEDKGIDATGRYELAPRLSVSIAVQAKRQAQNVGRPVVQNLNGSLKPHQQGLIITTAGFAKNAREEAARVDKPLIWLINGQEFVKLLIANDLGARRIPVELVEPIGFELNSGEDE
jgi:restriction system protein